MRKTLISVCSTWVLITENYNVHSLVFLREEGDLFTTKITNKISSTISLVSESTPACKHCFIGISVSFRR